MATKEHPILFAGAMVRAILGDRKTQTRRPVSLRHVHDIDDTGTPMRECREGTWREAICPYGVPGDLIWVRENWAALDADYKVVPRPNDLRDGPWPHVAYQADHQDPKGDGPANPMRWRPSIHMPRWASRILLEVEGVRVQRLQDIDNYDAKNEGVDHDVQSRGGIVPPDYYRSRFAVLWDFINAKRGFPWEDNPWVWAIDFRQVIA